jgi:hypothetical protein
VGRESFLRNRQHVNLIVRYAGSPTLYEPDSITTIIGSLGSAIVTSSNAVSWELLPYELLQALRPPRFESRTFS